MAIFEQRGKLVTADESSSELADVTTGEESRRTEPVAEHELSEDSVIVRATSVTYCSKEEVSTYEDTYTTVWSSNWLWLEWGFSAVPVGLSAAGLAVEMGPDEEFEFKSSDEVTTGGYLLGAGLLLSPLLLSAIVDSFYLIDESKTIERKVPRLVQRECGRAPAAEATVQLSRIGDRVEVKTDKQGVARIPVSRLRNPRLEYELSIQGKSRGTIKFAGYEEKTQQALVAGLRRCRETASLAECSVRWATEDEVGACEHSCSSTINTQTEDATETCFDSYLAAPHEVACTGPLPARVKERCEASCRKLVEKHEAETEQAWVSAHVERCKAPKSSADCAGVMAYLARTGVLAHEKEARQAVEGSKDLLARLKVAEEMEGRRKAAIEEARERQRVAIEEARERAAAAVEEREAARRRAEAARRPRASTKTSVEERINCLQARCEGCTTDGAIMRWGSVDACLPHFEACARSCGCTHFGDVYSLADLCR